jgi:hypothetical protein
LCHEMRASNTCRGRWRCVARTSTVLSHDCWPASVLGDVILDAKNCALGVICCTLSRWYWSLALAPISSSLFPPTCCQQSCASLARLCSGELRLHIVLLLVTPSSQVLRPGLRRHIHPGCPIGTCRGMCYRCLSLSVGGAPFPGVQHPV